MRAFNQIWRITLVNLRTIPQRLGTSLVVVVGIAGVVGVLVSVLAMAEGFRHTLGSTGRTSRVVMLRAGSDDEMSSNITREDAAILANLSEVGRDSGGRPLASAEMMVMADLPRIGGTDPNNVPFRGVQGEAFAIRDELKIVEGRPFARGVAEIIVGRKAAQQFAGLTVGSRLDLRGSEWAVVGIFTTGGDVHESEIWADVEVAMPAFGRYGFNSLTAKLADDSLTGFTRLGRRIDDDPRFSIKVLREPDYYGKQSKALGTLINVLGYMVATFMAIGAMFGALNCMYSAVASRQVEIATLRAIGFGGVPVVVSVMLEAMTLALVGGAIGAGLAFAYCNGATLSTLNFNTFSQVAFDFRVTPGLIGQGLAWAIGIGFVGGLFPAIRAARMPIIAALRVS